MILKYNWDEIWYIGEDPVNLAAPSKLAGNKTALTSMQEAEPIEGGQVPAIPLPTQLC